MTDEQVRERTTRIFHLKDKPGQLFTELDATPSEMLSAMLLSVAATGSLGASYGAVRQGIEAILARRHTTDLLAASDRVVQTMQKLDRSTNRLAIVGIVVGALIGIAGIILPLL